ncbi:MAG: hypothetical protein JSU73_13710 [candidate division WOR-3 bacterium]|nr:MAG: hypothetical protein JSU73_13710 [candidate division WOR-3 bacterium]
MKPALSALIALALAGALACDGETPSYNPITLVLSDPQGHPLEFKGRFGKHGQWEKVEGTTPDTFEFDLNDWPACFCLHRLTIRKTTAGDDTLRILALCHDAVVSDTFTTTQDSLDYWPTAP